MTQKYLIEYKCFNEKHTPHKTGGYQIFYKFCYSKSNDIAAVRRRITEESEKGEQVLAAWACDWANPEAEHQLVIGNPDHDGNRPSSTYLQSIRKKSKIDEGSLKKKSLVAAITHSDRQRRRAKMFKQKIAEEKEKQPEKKEPESTLPTHQPYALPVAAER